MTDPLYLRSGGTYSYYLNDHKGAPQKLVSSNGAIVWSMSCNAYGETVVDPASSVINPLRLSSQYYDAETGFHHNWFRNYDPELGTFLSRDPMGESEGFNLYAFCYANPVGFMDPDGRSSVLGYMAEAGVGMAFPPYRNYQLAKYAWNSDVTQNGITLTKSLWNNSDCRKNMVKYMRLYTNIALEEQLNAVQLALDAAGLIPAIGIVPDAVNTLISIGRGQWGNSGLNALAMIPLFGQGVTGGKWAARGLRYGDEVPGLAAGLMRNGDEAAGLLSKGKKLVSNLTGLKPFDEIVDIAASAGSKKAAASQVRDAIHGAYGANKTRKLITSPIIDGNFSLASSNYRKLQLELVSVPLKNISVEAASFSGKIEGQIIRGVVSGFSPDGDIPAPVTMWEAGGFVVGKLISLGL